MIIGAIVVGILIVVLLILVKYIKSNIDDSFDLGFFMGELIMILIVLEVFFLSNIIEEPTPSALDVYRGNTELEITSVNGIPTDTIVVYKKK